ncbi:hypothetical protein KSZ_72110 [Dictyobacter formicarum]|uniref:Uncharacterized protein n=1 Tax=Dictyobacter formicarum TaxID=2778368 RepID=A0ABQ3VTR7_9CHLR|nr:hypothetical protein KSZ_72110 [Dictyobacter formicarum]
MVMPLWLWLSSLNILSHRKGGKIGRKAQYISFMQMGDKRTKKNEFVGSGLAPDWPLVA